MFQREVSFKKNKKSVCTGTFQYISFTVNEKKNVQL